MQNDQPIRRRFLVLWSRGSSASVVAVDREEPTPAVADGGDSGRELRTG